jgi:hypothetical protein
MVSDSVSKYEYKPFAALYVTRFLMASFFHDLLYFVYFVFRGYICISFHSDLRLYQTPSGCFQATKSGSEACDMRFLYCACAISQMLNDWSGVNRDRAADYIWSCLSYEGGFALTPGKVLDKETLVGVGGP